MRPSLINVFCASMLFPLASAASALSNASYDDLAAWVQRELGAVWPAGKPSMTDRALDEALRLGTERWAAADAGREFASGDSEL